MVMPGGSAAGQVVYEDDYDIDENGDLWEKEKGYGAMPSKEPSRKEMREIARRVHEKIWLQKDGEEIAISEMNPGHLHNTIAMIKRGENANHPVNREYVKLMEAQLAEYEV